MAQSNPTKTYPQSKKTPAICEAFFAGIATGKSARAMCIELDIAQQTFWNWLDTDESLQEQYARAKLQSAEVFAEEILEISDDATNDWMVEHSKDGESLGYKLNGEHVQRSRLRVDTRKWLASKLAPKKYGDKVAIGGADDLPPVKTVTTNIPPVDAYAAMLTGNARIAVTQPADDESLM